MSASQTTETGTREKATAKSPGSEASSAPGIHLNGQAAMASADRPFGHAVYQQISLQNGRINRMTKQQMREKLIDLQLDPRGMKEVLKKRLKSYYQHKKLAHAQVQPATAPNYNYLLVIDFEATCEEYNGSHYKHEIIEFPAILVDTQMRKVVEEFHSYVRPVVNPTLTPFCTELTGITQLQVDRSPTFPEVLAKMESWMASQSLGHGKTFAVVTDGPWDMSRFMYIQCQLSQIPFPRWAKQWINLRKLFCSFYRVKRAKLKTMLENLGLTFEGHLHSGIDDTRNIARIVTRMLEDGCTLQINEKIFPSRQSQRLERDSNDSGKAEETELDCDMAHLSLDCNQHSGQEVSLFAEGDIDDLMTYYALQKS